MYVKIGPDDLMAWLGGRGLAKFESPLGMRLMHHIGKA